MKNRKLYFENIKLDRDLPDDKKIIDHYENKYHRLPFIQYLLMMVERQVEKDSKKD